MASPYCEQAIEDAMRYGSAILKFISPNDVDLTGGHQCGFLLPKPVWTVYTKTPPDKGTNYETEVSILWQDGRVTKSRVKWYGKDTRSEYRLTRFGKDFPFRTFDNVGDLLVLIPKSYTEFIAYVLYDDEDIEEIQTSLGVEVVRTWGVYQAGIPKTETQDECIERIFRLFVATLSKFPPGYVFSEKAREALKVCVKKFDTLSADDSLVKSMDAEYQLFQLAERQLCQPDIVRPFKDVDDFLQTATRILQRRKSRAGRSLENHVEQVLKDANIPHEMRPDIDGRPDVVIPNRAAYRDPAYPVKNLFIIGVKRTCKDRWRQVLNEGKRVPEKHILTLQPGISSRQLDEMNDAKVTLVVPKNLHKEYPKQRAIAMLSLEEFIAEIRSRLAKQ